MLFFPILLLEGLTACIERAPRVRAWPARATLGGDRLPLHQDGRLSGAGVHRALPGIAFVFLAVQLGLFGFYMGIAFAPNHKGMPIVPRGMTLDFLRRQVLMSRNIRAVIFSASPWAAQLPGRAPPVPIDAAPASAPGVLWPPTAARTTCPTRKSGCSPRTRS
jgi:hypothetical protein